MLASRTRTKRSIVVEAVDGSSSLSDETILQRAKAIFPAWTQILNDAFQRLEEKLTKDYVRKNFCAAVLEIEKAAYELFSGYEAKAFPELVVMWYEAHSSEIDRAHEREVMESLRGTKPLGEALKSVVRDVIRDSFPLIRKFQTSVSQMRKKRGGETFQEIVLRLLNKIDISCEKAKGEIEADLGHTDLVVPNIETAQSTPDRAVFMACQHTLAERWWSSTSITAGGRRGYLITVDKRLGRKKADRLRKYNLVAFVRDDVKEKAALKGLPWIRKLSSLPEELSRT
jgi:hypothetical protein